MREKGHYMMTELLSGMYSKRYDTYIIGIGIHTFVYTIPFSSSILYIV